MDDNDYSKAGFSKSQSGEYWFKTIGAGKGDETTCFIDARNGFITFEGSPAHRQELFGQIMAFRRRKP